eukprot:632112-Hanusia_phi.AAC.1
MATKPLPRSPLISPVRTHVMLVSATQRVAPHPVPPALAPGHTDSPPRLEPTSVTVLPDTLVFDPVSVDTRAASSDTDSVNEPLTPLTVSAIEPDPELSARRLLQTIELSDFHAVCATLVPPSLALAVTDWRPYPTP